MNPSEAAALWRARDEDRDEARHRFGRLEQGVDELKADVHEVKTSIASIEVAEKMRTESAEKRNQRLWQVGSGVLVVLLAALIITLVKVLAPAAAAGAAFRPPTVNEQLDRARDTLQEQTPHGER